MAARPMPGLRAPPPARNLLHAFPQGNGASLIGFLLLVSLAGCQRGDDALSAPPGERPLAAETSPIAGAAAGDEREVAGVRFCWCPAGRFVMGSPPEEAERRPGEDRVRVTLTKGFWIGKYEVTQGQWKRLVGEFPGPPQSDGRRLAGAARRMLGRPGLALPVGLPPPIRARTAIGPYRFPHRRRPPRPLSRNADLR